MVLRIGGVPYGVGAPLLGGLATTPGVDFVKEPPTTLIEKLRDGRLDAALVSSIEAIRAPGYAIAPELGIACRQEIRSVRAFRRRHQPIRTAGVDQSSATSVALLRLLLLNVHSDALVDGALPEFETVTPTTQPDELPQDVIMLIGDAGLAADPGTRESWDLGKQWVQWTGLPFVFAVWVVRRDVAAAELLAVLQQGRTLGRELGAVDGTHGAAHYDLDDNDLQGLRRFWHECRRAGLADCEDPPVLEPS